MYELFSLVYFLFFISFAFAFFSLWSEEFCGGSDVVVTLFFGIFFIWTQNGILNEETSTYM